MSTDIAHRTPAAAFAGAVQRTAQRQLAALAETADGQTAIRRVTLSFMTALQSARKPQDLANARPESIAACVAQSHDTGLYPGGPHPDVYLVPQSGDLQWRITHRGLCKLAARAGYSIMTVPVGRADRVRISMGELVEHDQDPATCVESLDDLLGVAVVIRRMDTGAVVARPWVPAAIIDRRRRSSRMSSTGPWKDWPIEMAQKSAILYCAARGTMPLESPEMDRVTAIEYREEEQLPAIEAAPEPIEATTTEQEQS